MTRQNKKYTNEETYRLTKIELSRYCIEKDYLRICRYW